MQEETQKEVQADTAPAKTRPSAERPTHTQCRRAQKTDATGTGSACVKLAAFTAAGRVYLFSGMAVRVVAR